MASSMGGWGWGWSGQDAAGLVSTVPSSLLTGLVAAYKLGEASGTRADDLATYNLAPTNAPGNAAGKIGNAVQLVAASTQYLSVTANALGFGTSSFTVGLWVYLDSNPTQLWMGHGNGGGAGFSWALQYVTPAVDRFDFYVGDNLGASALVRANNFGAVPLSTWLCIVAWKDTANSLIGIQINNGTPDTAAFAPNSGALAGALTLGIFPSLLIQPADGRADAVALWGRALTADERTEFYSAGAGKEYPF